MNRSSIVLSQVFALAGLISCDRPAPPPASQPDQPEPQLNSLVIPSRRLPPQFDDIDNDGDGYINHEEANNTPMSFFFTEIDANHDHTLSRLELAQYCKQNFPDANGCPAGNEKLVEGMSPQFRNNTGDPLSDPRYLTKIDSDFDSLNNDQNDYISRDEARDDNVYTHFGAMDVNNDNRLERWEFRAYIQEYGSSVAEDSITEQYFIDGQSAVKSKIKSNGGS